MASVDPRGGGGDKTTALADDKETVADTVAIDEAAAASSGFTVETGSEAEALVAAAAVVGVAGADGGERTSRPFRVRLCDRDRCQMAVKEQA